MCIFRSYKIFKDNELKLEAVFASFNKFQSFNHNLPLTLTGPSALLAQIEKLGTPVLLILTSVPQVSKDYQLFLLVFHLRYFKGVK